MYDFGTLVLVVDDAATMRKLVMKALKQIGFTKFIEAPDGAVAWKLLNAPENAIGLVLSDWNMPNSTGLDLLKRIRASSQFLTLPIYLVSAESEISQMAEAINCGVTGYLTKPFGPEALQTTLAQGFERGKKKSSA